MPGPGVQRGGKVVRRGTGGAPRQPRDTTNYTPTRQRVAPSRPVQAARQFVDHHVSIDRHGFPSLLPSAVQGIAKAVESVRNPTNLPSATTSVVSASGQATRPADPSVSVRMWKQMHGGGGKPVEAPKPKPTTPSVYRQARQTEKSGEARTKREQQSFYAAHPKPTSFTELTLKEAGFIPKPGSKAAREPTTITGRALPSTSTPEGVPKKPTSKQIKDATAAPKSLKAQAQHQAKLLKQEPKYGRFSQTGGAYSMSQGVGPGGVPVNRNQDYGPVGGAFNVIGQALPYVAAVAGTGGPQGIAAKEGLSASLRTGLRAALPEVTEGVGRREALQEIKQLGARGVAKRTFPRLTKAGSAAKDAPGLIREAPGAIKASARRTPTTVATVAATPEGRVAAARTIADTAYNHKAATIAALSESAKQAGVEPPGVKQVDAFLSGTKDALMRKPGHTLKTTARALPGMITAPVALGASATESVIHGNPDILTTEAKRQFEGAFWTAGPHRGILEKLLSGDPHVVSKAVANEGGLAFLPFLPSVTRTRGYEGARRDVRLGVGTLRRRYAASREDETLARNEKVGRRVRHAPAGVERPVFAVSERHTSRKEVSVDKQRASARHEAAIGHYDPKAAHLASKVEKKFPGFTEGVQTAMEYGVREPKKVTEVGKHGPTSETVMEGGINLKRALSSMEKHPEAWKDKDVQRLLKIWTDIGTTTPMALKGLGEAARVGPLAALFRRKLKAEGKPVPPELEHPTQQVPPEAKAFTDARDRQGAWDQAKEADKEIGKLRRDAQKREAQAQVLKGPERTAARKEVAELRKQAKELEAQNKDLKRALEPYTRPDQKVDTSSRTGYTDEMVAKHAAAVEAMAKREGYASPVWTHHEGMRVKGISHAEAQIPASGIRVQHQRAAEEQGGLAASDLVDRSYAGLHRGTLRLPRERAATNEFIQRVAKRNRGRYPVDIDGTRREVVSAEQYDKFTGPKSAENPNGGQYDSKTMGILPERFLRRPIEDVATREEDIVGLAKALTDPKTWAKEHPSEKGILVPRAVTQEVADQFASTIIFPRWNAFSSGAQAVLLGLNPAWLLTQLPAEGIPQLIGNPGAFFNVSRMRQFRELRETNPEAYFRIQGAGGVSRGRPSAMTQAASGGLPIGGFSAERIAQEGENLTRGKMKRALVSAAKLEPLRRADVSRQNAMYTATITAEIDKHLRSRTRKVARDLLSLIKVQTKITKDFIGKPREEMWNWLNETAEGRKTLDYLTEKSKSVTGDWNTISSLERKYAPLTIFYVFQRYALQWPLWLFPRDHPFAATSLYLLAQQNANRLEKLANMPHGLPLDESFAYAYPIFTTDEKTPKGAYGQAVLPAGARFSPGQSALQGALMSRNPEQIIGGAAPQIGALSILLTGKDPFGNDVKGSRFYAAADQFLRLTPARYAPGVDSQRLIDAALTGKADPAIRSALAQAFDKLDPNRRTRSFAAPFLSQPGAKFKQQMRLVGALQVLTDNSSDKRSQISTDAGKEEVAARGRGDNAGAQKIKRDAIQQIRQMHDRSKAAGSVLDRILSDLGLGQLNRREFAASLGISNTAEPAFGQGAITGKSWIQKAQRHFKRTGAVPPEIAKRVLSQGVNVGGGLAAAIEKAGGTGEQAAYVTPPKPAKGQQNAAITASHFPQTPKQQLQLAAAHTGQKGATPAQAEADGAKAIKSAQKTGLPGGEGVFAHTVSKLTGLSPRVVAAWTRAEGGNQSGDWNRLNIGHTDSGPNSAAMNSGWNDPKSAGRLTAQFLKGKYGGASPQIQQILSQARGKSDAQQIQIIANSGWAMDPAYQSKLTSVYNSVGGGAGPTSTKFNPTAPPALKQSFNKIVKVADNLSAAGIPYVWGGQHGRQKAQGPKTATGYDCSGAVSYILQKAGVKIPVLTSGALATSTALKPGPGAITVYANGTHTFMKIGNRYWGTSGSYRSASGPGWFNGTPSASYLSGFTARHVPGFGAKAAKQLGAKLVGGDTSGGLAGGAGGTGGGGVGGGSGGGGGLGTVAGLSGGGLSSKYTPPDYVGLTASSHVLSPITGIIKGTGSSSTSSLTGGTHGSASSFPSASANIAKLPEMPRLRSRRRRSTTSLSSR